MPKVKVNDINMYYEIHGKGDPVILIQGLGGNHTFWYPNLKQLSSKFKIVLLDYRGSGDTDKPDMEYTIRMFADDIAVLMDKIEIRFAHVVGRSMGGCIAQELAINYPDKVRSLILAATWAKADAYLVRLFEARSQLVEKVGLQGMFGTGVFMSYTRDFFEEKNKEHYNVIKKMVFANEQPPRAFHLQAMAGTKYNSLNRISKIKAATLVIHGKEDILVPPKFGEELAKRIPGAKLILLDNLGHAFYEQAPETFNKIAMDFWNKNYCR